jgi:hypothetical protein
MNGEIHRPVHEGKSMKKIILAAAVALALSAPAAQAADDSNGSGGGAAIGHIMEIRGSVTLTPEGGKPATAAVNAPLHLQDVVATGAEARARLRFDDDTEFALGEKTKITVDEYVYNPKGHSGAIYHVIEGAFKYVSGKLTKTKDHDASIQTGYGTIGIRGTSLFAGKIDGSFGIHVDEGRVDVKTPGGTVTLNAGQGTTLAGGNTPPTPPGPWSPDKTRRALLLVTIGGDGGHKPGGDKQGRNGGPNQGGGNTPPDDQGGGPDDMGGPDTFTPEVGGPAGGDYNRDMR